MKEKADSPVGVLEDYFRSSESDTSSSKEPTLDSEAQDKSKASSKWGGFLQLLRTRSKKPTPTLHPLNVLKLSKRMSRSLRETIFPNSRLDSDSSLHNSPWKIFTHKEILLATSSFSQGKQCAFKFGFSLQEIFIFLCKKFNFCVCLNCCRKSDWERWVCRSIQRVLAKWSACSSQKADTWKPR